MGLFKQLRFKFFLFLRLPAAWWSGLSVVLIDKHSSSIAIKYNWRTRNPFGSMYFACQAMAAEMASGLLAFNAINRADGSYSMFVKHLKVEFTKKAVGKIIYHCEDGSRIRELLENLKQPGESNALVCISTGVDSSGEIVSKFAIEWHFRKKR